MPEGVPTIHPSTTAPTPAVPVWTPDAVIGAVAKHARAGGGPTNWPTLILAALGVLAFFYHIVSANRAEIESNTERINTMERKLIDIGYSLAAISKAVGAEPPKPPS